MQSRRWPFLVSAIAAILIAGFLLIRSIDDDLIYYLTPHEAVTQRSNFPDGERFRLAGVVVAGSLQRDRVPLRFSITDGASTIPVSLTETPPLLFDEDVEVLLDGAWRNDHFRADGLLVTHDENYQAPAATDHAES